VATESVVIERTDQGVLLTLNRPEVGNRFNASMMQEWTAALKQTAREDPDFVVIKAAGDCFSLGRDQSEPPAPGVTKRDALGMILEANAALAAIRGLVVAQVNGAAKGFAAGVVVQSDFAVAAESATLCFDEVAHGFAPAIVMTYLEDIVGRKLATSMLIAGLPVSSERGAAAGLFTEVAPDAELEARTTAFVQRLAGLSAGALRSGKASMRALPLVAPEDRGAAALDILAGPLK
jgi:enoyl-CoA hydratase/carnithine racemase